VIEQGGTWPSNGKTGGSKIPETIAETLNESGMEVDAFWLKDVKKLSAKDCAFLVLGSPTRFVTMSFTVKRFPGKVKSHEWINKPFAAFGTQNPWNIERALRRLLRSSKTGRLTNCCQSSKPLCWG
jgi:menaquinone-dependent protoporphyrinogen IX oxidase